MAILKVVIDDDTREIKPYSKNITFTANGIHEDSYLLNATTGAATIPISHIGTIESIFVETPTDGNTKLIISYTDVIAYIIDLPLKAGDIFRYPVPAVRAGQISSITVENDWALSATKQKVIVRVYGN